MEKEEDNKLREVMEEARRQVASYSSYEEFKKIDQFKIFSIAVICNNAEYYLDMGINSILNQHFSFESNIQLILINNNSTDGTDSICTKYSKLYPENIVYVKMDEKKDLETLHKEALQYAKGEYNIILNEPYKLNRDVLSSLVIKINDDMDDDLFITIQKFEDIETNRFTYNFRDLDSSGIQI